MKRFAWILVLLMLATPTLAARKMTVQQLKDLLVSLQQSRKADAEVATELRQVELTEELTRNTMNSLVDYVSGPLSTEQIYVLEARSAVLAPPASDLPSIPAPDAAAQKALLGKAIDYASKTYAQLPHLTATKTTLRFQDNLTAVKSSSGMHSSASYGEDPSLALAAQIFRYINAAETPVDMSNGAEKADADKDKGQWGANGQIILWGQGPVLSTVLQEAEANGQLNWLRWEKVNGKPASVYAFSVDKKRTHYAVNYCCFPDTDQAGRLNYSSPTQGNMNPQAKGNLQTTTSWKNYKATVPYHGEIFVDPDTGIVVRLVTQAEFKASDVVHQEDQRIDYGPVKAGDKTLVLPVKSVIATEVVPNGDSGAGKYSTRHTLFTSEYKDYKVVGQ